MSACIIAGIGTNVGKTLVSSVLVQALGWDYWKPVQSGELAHKDTDEIRRLIQRSDVVLHEEAYCFNEAMSPHHAAFLDGQQVTLDGLKIPVSHRCLLIELAGGVMVPLREDFLVLDWLKILRFPVILVCRYYLGCINHTLMSVRVLQYAGIPVLGLVFNGEEVSSSREAILAQTGLPVVADIPQLSNIGPESVCESGAMINLKVLQDAGFAPEKF